MFVFAIINANLINNKQKFAIYLLEIYCNFSHLCKQQIITSWQGRITNDSLLIFTCNKKCFRGFQYFKLQTSPRFKFLHFKCNILRKKSETRKFQCISHNFQHIAIYNINILCEILSIKQQNLKKNIKCAFNLQIVSSKKIVIKGN